RLREERSGPVSPPLLWAPVLSAAIARGPELAAAIAKLPARTLILDGELCVFDSSLISELHLISDERPEEPPRRPSTSRSIFSSPAAGISRAHRCCTARRRSRMPSPEPRSSCSR